METLIKFLKTKRSAIANAIAFLLENVDDAGIVKNCQLEEIAKHASASGRTAQLAFQLLETNG